MLLFTIQKDCSINKLRAVRKYAVLLLLLLFSLISTLAQTTITSLSGITDPNGRYILSSGFSTSGTATDSNDGQPIGTAAKPFKGTIDGNLITITGTWNKPLFDYIEDATIKNVIIANASVSADGAVGTLAGTAKGASRIYNCGILDGSVQSTGGATDNPKTANCCGSLIGLLDGTSRVINCFSYATITGGNRVGGIVGYNNVITKASSINTMIMNCMFYGDITGGNKISPIYGGENINNLNSGGLNTFNYYAYDKLKTMPITDGMYNCALAVEERFLTHFEFYRLMLNSNRSLAAYYASTATATVYPQDMAKWVLESADKSIAQPKPYPVLKAQGRYPSIINYDVNNAPASTTQERNKGKKLGKTLTVNINLGSGYPTGASLTTSQLTLDRTDKDYDHFNFNYDKVQLPYYNDVGTKNYTGNKVVTGWKITAITAVTDDPYTSANYPATGIKDYPDHNYADRKSSNKDLYSVSKRVFSQGAYFDVPYGVESITIEPYWGNAAYLSDEYRDVVYNANYASQNVSQLGKAFGVNATIVSINGDAQKVYTSIGNALNALTGVSNPTVYDYAIVLVGNFHQGDIPSNGSKPFTLMSIDLDKDNEPDCSCIYNHGTRASVSPIRFDFINVIGTAQAQKPNGAANKRNAAIFRTLGWFEITNTALMYFSQFEYENTQGITKAESPLILLGGVFDQFTSTQNQDVLGKTIYIHIGSNVWIKNFGPGTHSDGSKSTPHVPVSVTGGDYDGFYLTGTYNANADVRSDNAECYISGGRFSEVAGASMEQIDGNVRWQIYDADITEFFGGGINDAKPITGTITTEIFNSHVGLFCGGPKFGNMTDGKDVTTTAQNCTFDKFFGAGYGGNSFSRKKYFDSNQNINWSTTLQNYYINDRGRYYDGKTTNAVSANYGKKGPGVAVDFDYEFFVWTSGATGGRFFVKFVTFSLAQCGNVESSLTDCTINSDFYGGGSLGKVTGTAKSTLDGCTVNGNVFGGGYSATKPKIPVRRSGFDQVPNYNKNSGMFEPGVLSGIDYYEWKHVDNYPSNGANGFVTENGKNYVVTTADLESLGQVGNTDLTVTGNTIVRGGVFGGGDQSETVGNTDVKVQTVDDNQNYTIGYVYGGGNVADVGGNVLVTLTTGTVLHDVYGGGAKANTNINNDNTPKPDPLVSTVVNLNGGTVRGDIYGGGLGNADTAALVWGDATVTLNGTKLLSTGRVFGGNNINGTPKGHIKVDIKKTVSNGQSIDLDAVFGGGNMAAYQPSDPDDYAEVLIEKANAQDRLVFGSVYGGGNEADVVAGTSITLISGDIISGIYGGCNTQGTVNGPILVDIYGNVGTSAQNVDVFGGGFGPATGTNGNITVNIGNLTGYAPIIYGDIYGGSALGSVNNDAQDYTTVNVLSGQIHGNVFGGGLGESGQENVAKGQVNGTVIVNIGTTDGQQTPTYSGNATLYGSVYGCNNTNGSPQGNVTVNIYCTAHTTTNAAIYTADDGTNGAPTYAITDVFGGGRQADYTPSSDQSRATVYIHGCDNTIEDLFGGGDAAAAYGVVTIVDGGRFHRIFGGGNGEFVPADIGAGGTGLQVHGGDINQLFGGSNTNGVITGPMNTTVDSDGPCGQVDITEFFCGNNLASIGTAQNPTSIVATIGCGTNFGDVYGGCNLADIYGDITLNIEGGTIGRVFGGSKGRAAAEGIQAVPANIFGNVTLNITGGDISDAFGGSNINGNISGSIEVNVEKSANPCIWQIGNIYGASNDATYTPTADGNSLTVNIMNGEISGSVYGGGKGATAVVTSNPVVTIGDDNEDHLVTITGNVYGGGDAAAVAGNTTVIYNDNNAGSTVPKLFGGGNAANVSGTTSVNITSGKVTQGVYGGCNSTGSVGDVAVVLNGGNVGDANTRADVYGGGYGSATTTTGDIVVTLNGTNVYGDIYGGSALGSVNSESANPLNTTTINLQSATLHGSVFGGGMGDNNTTPNPTTAISNGNAVVNINAFNPYLTGVYGGANVNGLVYGNIEVNINANVGTDQNGLDIFGGGLGENTGTIGNVTVTMGSLSGDPAPIVYGDIYGGSALGSVNDEGSDLTTVNIYSGTITGNIYGGGLGEAGQANVSKGQVNGAVIVNIGSTDGAQVPTYSGFATINGSVYGCNNTNGSPQDNVTVNVYKTGHTQKNAASYTQDDATYAIDQVFGGGNQADYSPADGKKATIHVFSCDNTIRRLFGGGNAAAASGVVTIIDGGRLGYVFGGGNGEVTAANIGSGGTDLQIHGGNIAQLFGGSNKNGIVEGTMGVSIDNDGDCGQDMFIAEFFCGNNEAPLTTDIEATIGCGTHFGDVYGGCNLADMTGNIILNIEGGRMANVYGGSKGSDGDAADITGSVTLNIKGGYIEQNAFGGSNVNGNITGAITVNVDWMQSSCADGQFLGNVYGGSNLATYTPTTAGNYPAVYIKNGTVSGNVYGGGKGSTAVVTSNPNVTVGDATQGYVAVVTGDVYGGGDAAAVIGTPTVSVINKSNTSIGSVYGGGNAADVSATNVTIDGGTIGNVYGGGHGDKASLNEGEDQSHSDKIANVNGNVSVTVTGGTITRVFGGSNTNGTITGTDIITVEKGDNSCELHITELYGGGNLAEGKAGVINIGCTGSDTEGIADVYGGANQATVTNDIALTITGGSIQRVFGGNNTSGTINGTIAVNVNWDTQNQCGYNYLGSVFGGGNHADYAGTPSVTITNGTVHNVYGGGNEANVAATIVNMNGGTVLEGIYGGCNTSGNVLGDVLVNINGGTMGTDAQHTANIHGGGYGPATGTSGNVEVTIGSAVGAQTKPTIYGDVYGGSALGKVNGTELNNNLHTYVTLNAGTINGSLYGGALGDANTAANVYAPVQVTVNGGTVTGGVYGCNNVNGAPQGSVTVDINGTDQLATGYALAHVFGGGNQAAFGGTPVVTLHNNQNMIEYVYGGGNQATVTGTDVTVYGGSRIGYVFGGGYGASVTQDGTNVNIYGGIINKVFGGNDQSGTVTGNISVTIDKQTETGHESCLMQIDEVYGGGNVAASQAGTLTIRSTGGDTEGINYVFGGANDADVTGDITLNITGGRITNLFGGNNTGHTVTGNIGINVVWNDADGPNDSKYLYNVYGGGQKADVSGNTVINIEKGTITNDVYGGGMEGHISGSVTVNIGKSDGTGAVTVGHDVYGGGALANTNTGNLNNDNTITTDRHVTNINLYPGATITHDVYGGGLGRKASQGVDSVQAIVYGDVTVTQFGAALTAVYDDDELATSGRIFGCNNINGTPKGHVLVNIKKTAQGSNPGYDLAAVYGGGNEAEYWPDQDDTEFAEVLVSPDNCNDISIHSVYGGGNAASTPATKVTIYGAYEIKYVFGGGNGAGDDNPGANVGYHDYSKSQFTGTSESDIANRKEQFAYGTGIASTNVLGGHILNLYGGSNTKGNIRQSSIAMLDELSTCQLIIESIHGGGREAYMEGKAILDLGCITGMPAIYGGSENADVGSNVELTISSGHFDKVFGGNNKGGRIFGSITVNIEQTGCLPITIGELYLGGNNAPYSVYGYGDHLPELVNVGTDQEPEYVTHYDLKHKDSPQGQLYDNPILHIRSFDSIGTVYGGGNGSLATMIADPIVEINETKGWVDGLYSGSLEKYSAYKDTPTELADYGQINTVFGGGNLALVEGNTTILIGDSLDHSVKLKSMDKLYNSIPSTGIKRGNIKEEKSINDGVKTITYTVVDQDGNPVEGKEPLTVTIEQTIYGAIITGNVYGGGNNADVTGNTNIQIGPKQ